MNQTDRAILETCAEDYHRLKELQGRIPGGTLYRHAARLRERGWLERQGPFYRTTETGRRSLIEANHGRQWNQLEQIYRPLALIPTTVHRALIELTFAAVVARQHTSRPDRHPFFVCVGGTLHWKTSAGIFLCHALGLDPGLHIVDCGSETGKSLFIRRAATGKISFQRDLLGTPFVVLDEFLTADRAVRNALHPFLSGRLVVPFENEQVTLRPVPLLTLNPVDDSTVEGRLGLSAPLVRRAIIANVDGVSMPDLAAVGQHAITASQTHPHLTLNPPAVDCQSHHRAIVDLVRNILQPDAYERVDVEIVVNLCTGMTGLLPDGAEAIVQVAHRLGVLAETMQWARPGWIELVCQFSIGSKVRPMPLPKDAGATGGNGAASGRQEQPSLALESRPVRRESGLPSLHLSDELRGTLTWLAVETGRSLEDTFRLLVRHYLQWRRSPDTVSALHRSLALAQDLRIAKVEPQVLAEYLQARADLARYGRTLQDVAEALRFISLLARLPEPWNWDQARNTVQGLAVLIAAGITPECVRKICILHERLDVAGFDEKSAEALATLLERTSSTGRRRHRVLAALVELAGDHADLADATLKRAGVDRDVTNLERKRADVSHLIEAAQTRLADLQRKETESRKRLSDLEEEVRTRQSELDVTRALKALLLSKQEAVEPFWRECEQLLEIRRVVTAFPKELAASLYTPGLREKILRFLSDLCAEAEASR